MKIRSNIPKLYALSFIKNMMFFGAVAVPFFIDWGELDYTHIFLLVDQFFIDI